MLAWVALPAAPVVDATAADSAVEAVAPDLVGGREVELAGARRILLLWGSNATILWSEDGIGWQTARTRASADLAQLAADDTGSVMVAVGAQGTLLRSTDAGKTWTTRRTPSRDVNLLTVTSAGNRVWVVAGTGGQIWRSLDDAQTWKVVKSPLAVTLRALSFDAASGRLLLGGDDGLLGYSDDQGENWHVTSIDMLQPVTAITAIYRFGTLLLATSGHGRFLVSSDGADNWDLLQSTSTARITTAAHQATRGIILLASDNGDVVRSRDDGRSWEVGEVTLGGTRLRVITLQLDARTGEFLVTGADGTLARSADGETWEPAFPGLRGEPRGLILDSRGALIAYGPGGLIARAAGADSGWTYATLPSHSRH
jgi:photosystem II stability/assembly factor-like uncharacterized protein